MAGGMRLVATGSRLVVGAMLAVALVVGVVLLVPLGLPEVRHDAARAVISPEASDTTLVCSGPFRALGRNAADAWEMQAAANPGVHIAGDLAEAQTLDAADLDGAAGVQVLSVPAERSAGAAHVFVLADADLTGVAAGACRPPSMQAWIVGGAVAVGTSDVLTIANPGDVSSRVTLTTYGGTEVSTRILVIPARTQHGVPLASTAAGAGAPVVQVVAEGAPVHVSLQSSLVRTLDPAGVDLQDSAGLPETQLVFAGVRVTTTSTSEQLRLRVLSPDVDTTVRIRVRAVGAEVDEQTVERVEVLAGEPLEVGFVDLPRGTYSVHLDAADPVVGAVWQSGGTHPGADFAWMTPAPVLDDAIVAATPPGADSRLHLVNAGDEETSVVLDDLDRGRSEEHRIPAGSSTVIALSPARGYEIRADAAVHAAIALHGDDVLAGWPLWPTAQQRGEITVYP